MSISERLFNANQPPVPINQLSNWLDTPEGKHWFLNPIIGWDENGTPIRKPLDCSQISVGQIDTTPIKVLCLRCGKTFDSGECECSNAERLNTDRTS